MTLPTAVADLISVNVVGAPGTATFTLGTAISGYRAFAGNIADGTQVTYGASDGVNSEVSRGTLGSSGTALTRGEAAIAGTNGTSLVNFTASGVVVSLVFAGPDFSELISDVNTLLAGANTIDGGTF